MHMRWTLEHVSASSSGWQSLGSYLLTRLLTYLLTYLLILTYLLTGEQRLAVARQLRRDTTLMKLRERIPLQV